MVEGKKRKRLTEREIKQAIKNISGNSSMTNESSSLGVTRQGLRSAILRFQPEFTIQRTIHNVICHVCGKQFNLTPSRFKRSKHHFCSTDCFSMWYMVKVEQPKIESFFGREAVRTAQSLNQNYDISTHSIHFIDRNNKNSSMRNIEIFETEKEHILYHLQNG
jgi:hypothetical protein